MLKLTCAVAASVCLLCASAAYADTVSYTLNLDSSVSSSNDGTGSLTISTAPKANGTTKYTQNSNTDTLDTLSFTVDGHTFDLNSSVNDTPSVQFSDAVLSQVTYSGTDYVGFLAELTFDADRNLNYTVSFDGVTLDGGKISATEDTPMSAAPEPASLALLGTGLLGVIGVARRRLVA